MRDFGLADRWSVRVNGQQLEGSPALSQVAALQKADASARIELCGATSETKGQSSWVEVYPSVRLDQGSRIILWLIGASVGAYVFNGNSQTWAPRLPVALAVGLGTTGLAGMSLWWALGSYLSFCHLFFDHPRAFWRGAWPGAVGGVLLGCLAWHSYLGFRDAWWSGVGAVGAVSLLGAAGGLLFAYGRARSEHDQEWGGPCVCAAARRAGQVLAALLLTSITVPIPATVIDTNLDPSWRAVLDYAYQHRLQFGTDVVFTYGPLGFLTVPDFLPDLAGLRMITSLVLSFVICLGVTLVAWRLALFWRFLLIAAFVACSIPTILGTDVMLQAGILCWGVLCLAESGLRLRMYAVTLVLIAMFASLTKMTFLPEAGLCLAVIACDCAVRDRRALALTIALGFAAGALILWIALGQLLSGLPGFLAGACTVAKDYNLAMGGKTDVSVLWHGTMTIVCAGATVIFRSLKAFESGGTVSQRRRGLLLVWSCGLLFLTWKHGFVHGGPWHVRAFLAVVPMLALAFGALQPKNAAAERWGSGLALACCCYVFANPLAGLGDPLYFISLGSLRRCTSHVHSLLRPTEYWCEMMRKEQEKIRRAELTRLRQIIGEGAVDVFGYNQSFALHNRLNYRPRPVFQSYTAYSPPLMRLNEQFYLSAVSAPDYALFRLSTLYERFPPVEDALVLRLLLQNYEPVEAEGPFLLLKLKSCTPSRLTLLREGTAQPGEPIELEAFGGLDLWLEITLESTLLGRMRQFLYKPPQVWLKVEGDGSEGRADKFWAPARMLEAGFLASPLVLDNLDVLHVYTGEAMVRPRAYSLDAGPAGRYYRTPFRYRIYRIENRLGRCAPQDLGARLEPIVKKQLPLPPEGIGWRNGPSQP